ncbi:hypothetical protein RJT34_20560 [Clitoria ternatea]|uniref:Uncharacterized protein n=1 Tax=Clitoria ternatea TaxID=43366 RepID=A0AAN9ITC0_CLITE
MDVSMPSGGFAECGFSLQRVSSRSSEYVGWEGFCISFVQVNGLSPERVVLSRPSGVGSRLSECAFSLKLLLPLPLGRSSSLSPSSSSSSPQRCAEPEWEVGA